MAAPKRGRAPRPPQPRELHIFRYELALVYGRSEAGEVARDRLKVHRDPQLGIFLTLVTNPDWAPAKVTDADTPGGVRGLDLSRPDDARQLDIAEEAMAIGIAAETVKLRSEETLKEFADAEVARHGSTRAFAAELVSLVPGPVKRGTDAAKARERQIKAQMRKIEEWRQVQKATTAKGKPTRFPGEPKYVRAQGINWQRILAYRGDPLADARSVLEGARMSLGASGWWMLSEDEHAMTIESDADNAGEAARARDIVLYQVGRGFVTFVEAVANGQTGIPSDAEGRSQVGLYVVYQLLASVWVGRATT